MTTDPISLPHPLLRCAVEVGAAIDEVAGCEPAYLPAAQRREVLLELFRQTERLKALQLRILHECGDLAAEEPADDGGTLVTQYYDWSQINDEWKERNIFPVVPESALRA